MSTVIPIVLGERSYDVVIAPSYAGLSQAFSGALDADRAILVTDRVVGPLWAERAEAALGVAIEHIVSPVDEAHKSLSTWAGLVESLLRAGVDRRTPVIALGGGVVGDVAGFAAASTLRGLPFVQLPTTLLAMVDSSVGGKTGVNHPLGKNLVGAFYQPQLVFAGLHTLDTLNEGERIAGLGEVLKTALIGDAALLDFLDDHAESLRSGDREATAHVVARCVAIKADVVAADERERGTRAWLNAGHTVGHGYEYALGYGTLRHGEAVALGLLAETAWAVREGVCRDASLPRRLADVAARCGLPTTLPRVSQERVVAGMRVDKKLRADILRLPVPLGAGAMTLVDLPSNRLAELLPPESS
jgi:3-dehydroquinate synthase